jgi:hypothetical protein
MVVRAGSLEGLRTVYTAEGELITLPGERILHVDQGWDLHVRTPWRRFLPTIVFMRFPGDTSSRLYVTTDRIVLIREIDPFRETKGDMTPYGFPSAVAKKIQLSEAKAAGARAFCELLPQRLLIVKLQQAEHPRSWVDLRLLAPQATQFAVTFWSGKESDPEMQAIILSRFARKQDAG